MAEATLQLEADLSFRCTLPDGSPGVTGSVTADGPTINVVVTGPLAVAGKSSRLLVRQVAEALAKRRLRIIVRGPGGTIIAFGDVPVPRWQRLLTRSPHIRLGNVREVRRMLKRPTTAVRGRRPAPVVFPPLTMFPLFPTVSTLGLRPVTTTHDPRGGGMPRVIFASRPQPRVGELPRVEHLTKDRTTFGSSDTCDVTIAGLQPMHAVIERTEADEYLLTHLASQGTSTVAGVPAQRSLLRTGARIALGATQLTYFREEYADHGRPFGGRQGGEIGYQRPQATPRQRRQGAVGRPRTNRDPGQYYP